MLTPANQHTTTATKIILSTVIVPALMGLLLACHSTAIAERNTPSAPSPLNPASQPGDGSGSLSIQGQTRTYLLHTPTSYRSGQPMPLVLAFHGYGSQGKDMAQATGLSNLAEQQRFLVAYPDGLERRWRIAADLDGSGDDRAFVGALIQHLTQIRAVDPNRIYVVGVSNGGFLVQNLACTPPGNASPRIAAFATVASTLLEPLRSACHPLVPVSMMMINGTADQKVPWQGGERPYGSLVSIPAAREFWQQHDRCATRPQVISQANPRIEIERSLNCQGGSEVEAVTLKGAGHIWPRGGGGANSLLNGSQEIWSFFQRHSRR